MLGLTQMPYSDTLRIYLTQILYSDAQLCSDSLLRCNASSSCRDHLSTATRNITLLVLVLLTKQAQEHDRQSFYGSAWANLNSKKARPEHFFVATCAAKKALVQTHF